MSEPQGALKGIALGIAGSFLIAIGGLVALVVAAYIGWWLWAPILILDIVTGVLWLIKRRRSKRESRATSG